MNDFTYMHVFFAVTTAAVILTTALVGGLVVALTRLFATLNRIAGEVEEEAEEIRADLSDLREDMKEGFRIVPLFNFFSSAAKRVTRKKKPRIRTRKSSRE